MIDEFVFPWEDDPNYTYLARREPWGTFYYRQYVGEQLRQFAYRTKDPDEARLRHVARFGETANVEDGRRVTGDKAFVEFCDRLRKRGRKEKSIRRYESSWRNDAAEILGPMLVHRITPKDVLRVLDRAKSREKKIQTKKGEAPRTGGTLSASSIKRLHSCLSSFGAFCCSPSVNYAKANFGEIGADTPPTPPPAATGDFVVFSDEEVDAIAAHVSQLGQMQRSSDRATAYKRRTFALLAPEVGTRISELLAVQISDVEFLQRRMRVDKQVGFEYRAGDPETWYDDLKGRIDTVGERPRWVPLSEFALELLAQYIKKGREERWLPSGDGLLFPSMEMTPIDPSRFSAYLKASSEVVGRPVRSHYFRHTYVSNRVAAGIPIEEVAEYIGADPAVAKSTYLHLLDRTERMAAAAASGRKASAL